MREEILHRYLHAVGLRRPKRHQHVCAGEAHLHELRDCALFRSERDRSGGRLSLQHKHIRKNTNTSWGGGGRGGESHNAALKLLQPLNPNLPSEECS